MDLSTWLLGAATLAVGAVVTLVAGLVQEGMRRRWARADADESARRTTDVERRRRIQERSENAANEILELLDKAYELFHDGWKHGGGPDQQVVLATTRPIRRLTVLLGGTEVRRRIEGVATLLEQSHAIENMTGDVPSRIAWKARVIGRNALGHLLSDEDLEADEVLRQFLSAIDEYHQMFDLDQG